MPKRIKKIICPICAEPVEDAVGKKKGHESAFCDGECKEWVHRQCAGLSKSSFSSVSSSSDPFHCPRCLISYQSAEISSLKKSVEELSTEVAELKALVLSIRNKASTDDPAARVLPEVPTTLSQPHTLSASVSQKVANRSSISGERDRKYNVVVFGVQEMPSGSPRLARAKHDFSELSAVFSGLERDTEHTSSISRDCHRLGKYIKGKSSSRPLLVTLKLYC